jgi:MoaA/NifB/PqqE/SkfB family radical SAM enzyme
MEAQLKLKEVIWEITSECKNNCKYCGSKHISSLKPLNKKRNYKNSR